MILDELQIVRSTFPHGVANVDMGVRIGECEKPLFVATPLFFYSGKRALAELALEFDTFIATSDPDNYRCKTMFQYMPDKAHSEHLFTAAAISLKLHAPKCVPDVHPDILGESDIAKQVLLIKELTRYKKPVAVESHALSAIPRRAKTIEPQIEFRGGRPDIGTTYSAKTDLILTKTDIILMDSELFVPTSALRERKGDKRIFWVAEFKDASTIFKALALGVDCVGVKAHDTEAHRKHLRRMIAELRALIASTGHSSLDELSPDDLRATTYNAAAITGVRLSGYERALPMWEH